MTFLFGGSSNGRTRDSDSRYLGSNPSPPAKPEGTGVTPASPKKIFNSRIFSQLLVIDGSGKGNRTPITRLRI